jgi:hypothetical protein
VILLDTNVVSEPLKPAPDPKLLAWLAAQSPETLYLSTVTVAEMLAGVERMPKGRKREIVRDALTTQVFALFPGRILTFDMNAAEAFAKVISYANASGNPIGFADAAIAAIAAVHGFHVATRNARDFKGSGVELINPWAA